MKRTRVLSSVAALVALAALAGCGGDGTAQVDRDDLEEGIASDLEKEVGARPDKITCPGDLAGEVGETMRCELTEGADSLGLTVEVTEVDGTDVAYSIVVDEVGEGSE